MRNILSEHCNVRTQVKREVLLSHSCIIANQRIYHSDVITSDLVEVIPSKLARPRRYLLFAISSTPHITRSLTPTISIMSREKNKRLSHRTYTYGGEYAMATGRQLN